jgi:hypothetical protein
MAYTKTRYGKREQQTSSPGWVRSISTPFLSPAHPTCVDPHLSTLNASFAHSIPVVEVDGHFLIDFKQCSQVAEQIESLVQYSPPRTRNTTRPDVLAYVESSLKSRSGDDTVRAVEKRSANLAGEEQSLLEHRKKMKSLGFAWSPPRRK